MHKPASQSVQKTDKRDAILISECLSNGTYKSVYVLTKEDNEIKEYLRMRDDRVDELVRCKQQINAFVLRQGKSYSGTKWTDGYKKWLNELQLSPVLKETLDEYLLEFNRINESIERINKRIDEFTQLEKYNGDIKKMSCLLGIERRTALRIITEIGDFKRFPSAAAFARFLGITPGEHSSGESNCKLPITKTGNSQLRSVLIESAQGICKGKIGYKSRRLKVRQEGNSPEIIQYADHANIRMRSKFYKMTRKGKKRNVAVVAVARELSCFIWGMMTGHTKIA